MKALQGRDAGQVAPPEVVRQTVCPPVRVDAYELTWQNVRSIDVSSKLHMLLLQATAPWPGAAILTEGTPTYPAAADGLPCSSTHAASHLADRFAAMQTGRWVSTFWSNLLHLSTH